MKLHWFGCSVTAGAELETANRLGVSHKDWYEWSLKHPGEGSAIWNHHKYHQFVQDENPSPPDFTAIQKHGIQYDWYDWCYWGLKSGFPRLVSDALGLKYQNWAEGGSDVGWQINYAVQKVRQGVIESGDTLIFGITNPSRHHYWTRASSFKAAPRSRNADIVKAKDIHDMRFNLPGQITNAYEEGYWDIWLNKFNEYEKTFNALYYLYNVCQNQGVRLLLYATVEGGQMFHVKHDWREYIYKQEPTLSKAYSSVQWADRGSVRLPKFEDAHQMVENLWEIKKELDPLVLHHDYSGSYGVYGWIKYKLIQEGREPSKNFRLEKQALTYEEYCKGNLMPFGHPNHEAQQIVADIMTPLIKEKI